MSLKTDEIQENFGHCLPFVCVPPDSETGGKRGAINYHHQISRCLPVSAHVGIRVHTTTIAGLGSLPIWGSPLRLLLTENLHLPV